MAITTRVEFKDYILRELGEPVIEINVDDSQVDDRIQDAIDYYHLHHYDGTVKLYTKHTITQTDIDNEYITTATPVISVIKVFQNRAGAFSSGIFNEEFQLHLNNVETLSGGGSLLTSSDFGLQDFAISSSFVNLLNNESTAEKTFLYNKTTNQLRILHNWSSEFSVGEIIVIELWSKVDPDTNPEVFDDVFLKEYAIALVKKQWGNNLSKYDGVQLPGGITLNGDKIKNEAEESILRLQEEMLLKWSTMPSDLIG